MTLQFIFLTLVSVSGVYESSQKMWLRNRRILKMRSKKSHKEKSAWDIGEGERNDAMRMKLPQEARKCMHPISSWFRPLCLYHTQRTAKCGTRSRNVQKPLCHSCPSLNGYALKLLCLTSANGNQEKLPNGYNAIGHRLCFSVCTGISKYVDDAIDVIVSTS